MIAYAGANYHPDQQGTSRLYPTCGRDHPSLSEPFDPERSAALDWCVLLEEAVRGLTRAVEGGKL